MNRAGLPATSRFSFWIAFYAVLLLSSFSGGRLHAQSANTLYKQGVSAEAREDYDAAYDFYQKAYAKNGKDLRFRTALYRVRVTVSSAHVTKGRKLLASGDEQGALSEFLHAAEIDPGNEAALQEIAHIRARIGETPTQPEPASPEIAAKQDELDSMAAPLQLKPVSNEPLILHMTEDAKVVYQAIGRAAGINVLFDPDYISKRIQVDLNNMSLMDALRVVGTMSNTFWRPITNNSIFVAQNSRAKRQELDEQAVQTFYLANAWQQNDINDVQTALRNVLGANIKVYGVASQNAIVVRGTPDELLLAQKLVNDLDKARPEVVVDIAVMEVSKNWERTLGIQWPSSIGIALQSPTASTTSTSTTDSTTSTTTPTLYNLAHLNSNDFAVTVGSATVNLLLNDSNTKILQNPRLRATDAQKATMKVGERIPIATGSYQTGASTALVSSLVNTQFTYIDVGVEIEITPTVHADRDVTLKTKIGITAQSSSVTISGVTEPIIAQKTTEQTVRLREGEANIMSGILNQEDQVSWSGIPGLSSIPILKYLFGSKDHTITDDEVVFVMVPHVVRAQDLTPTNLRTIDTGAGQSIELRHISAPGPGANAAPQIHPTSSQSSRSTVGTVPGQSALAAAPAALAQMRSAASASGAPPVPTVPQTNLNATSPPSSDASTPSATPPATVPPPSGPGVSFLLSQPSSAVTSGSTFEVPIVVSGGTDIASIPLQVQYDASKLSLVNVGAGDYLSRDGQAVALVHRDEGPGNVTIHASRPPGAAGVNGAGVVCVLSFQAKAAGESTIAITRPGAVNSAQQPVPSHGSQISIQVK
jgi:general secretion pathway protein D